MAVAAAAVLAMGEGAEGTPAALVRGAGHWVTAGGRAGRGQRAARGWKGYVPVTGHILALSGGVGGAKLTAGLAAVLPPEQLTIAVNTGDDFEHLGSDHLPGYRLGGLCAGRAE